jgi:Domain of unknown function (DUF4062)
MAYFAARATSPAAVCVDTVEQSDVYAGIIGLRFGAPVRDRPEVSAFTDLTPWTAHPFAELTPVDVHGIDPLLSQP